MSDPDVLRIAAETGRIVVSHDRKTMTGSLLAIHSISRKSRLNHRASELDGR